MCGKLNAEQRIKDVAENRGTPAGVNPRRNGRHYFNEHHVATQLKHFRNNHTGARLAVQSVKKMAKQM